MPTQCDYIVKSAFIPNYNEQQRGVLALYGHICMYMYEALTIGDC